MPDIFDQLTEEKKDIFDELEYERSWWDKTKDTAKEVTAGAANYFRSWELQHERKLREGAAEGNVELGLDMRDLSIQEKRMLGQKAKELQESGLSYDEQLEQMNQYREDLVRKHAEEGIKGAQRMQEAMPKPEHAPEGLVETGLRGIAHFAFPMALGFVPGAGPASWVALFETSRGHKIKDYEQRKQQALSQAKDPSDVARINKKYSDQNIDDHATLNALLESTAEYGGNVFQIGALKKVWKSLRGGKGLGSSRLRNFVTHMSQTAVPEGFEEWVQTHTEMISDMFFENPEEDPEIVWGKVKDEFFRWEHQKQAIKQFGYGVFGGAVLGLPGGAISLIKTPEGREDTRGLTRAQKREMKSNPLLRSEDFREEEIGEGGFPKRMYVDTPADVFGKEETKVQDLFDKVGEGEETKAKEADTDVKPLPNKPDKSPQEQTTQVQTTHQPGGISTGMGTQERIVLTDRLERTAERRENEEAKREAQRKALEKEKQLEQEMAARAKAQREAELREAKRKAHIEGQRRLEAEISTKEGLLRRSLSLIPAMKDSGDPVLRDAGKVAEKAHEALVVGEDSTKKLTGLQNDIHKEQQRVTDSRAMALLQRLDQELDAEVARIDTLVSEEKAAREEKKPADSKKEQPAGAEFLGYQRPLYKDDQPMPLFNLVGGNNDGSTVGLDTLKKEGIQPPEYRQPLGEEQIPQIPLARPKKQVGPTETPYKTDKERVAEKAATKRAERTEKLKTQVEEREAGKAAAKKGVESETHKTDVELAKKKALDKKVKPVKKGKPRRSTVEESPYEQKERTVYHVGKKPKAEGKREEAKYQLMTPQEAASKITDETYLNGSLFGDVVSKVEKSDESITNDLKDVASKQGKSFYVDVMHPGKIGARIYNRLRNRGASHAQAKEAVSKSLEAYKPKYEEIAAKYMLMTKEEQTKAKQPETGTLKEIRAKRTALNKHKEYLGKEIDKAMTRAKLVLKNLPGGSINVKVSRNPNDIVNSDPSLYDQLERHGATDLVKATYDPNTNTIHVFTDRFNTTLEAKRSLWHELGHGSLKKLLGKDLASVLDGIIAKHPDLVKEKRDLGYPNNRDAAEDVLIDMFTSNQQNRWTNRLKELLSKLARKVGFKKDEITNEDMMTLVRNIRTNLTGEGVDAAGIQRIREKGKKLPKREDDVEYNEQAKYLLAKEGQRGTALGNILKWDYFKIAKQAGGPDRIKDYIENRRTWAGRKLTPEGRKYISNMAAKFKKNPAQEQELKEIIDIRKQLAAGILKEDSQRYKDALKKYGSKIEGASIRHTSRFKVGVNTIYGPRLSSDRPDEQVKTHPVRGSFKTTVYTDKNGRTVLDRPILPKDKKKREAKIDSLFRKNKRYASWYQDWNDLMHRLKNSHVPVSEIPKYIKIQAILAANSGPQGNQKLFRVVIDALRSGKDVVPGSISKGGIGITQDHYNKIKAVWDGKESTDVLEEMQDIYGKKIGAYMAAGLNPQEPGAIVLDRHMPRLWGYNILWTADNKHGDFNVRPEIEQEIVQEIKDAAKRNNTTPAGMQAALWFAIRPPDVTAESYGMAAKLQPSKYLPRVFYRSTVPESMGMGVHYKRTLVDKGDFVYGATKDGKIHYNTYSRNDVGKRIEAHTPKNPYMPLVYTYEAGTQPEAMVESGRKAHIVNLDRMKIYDAVNDPLNFQKTVMELKADDPFAHPTNILARLIKKGGYDGFMVNSPYGKGRWILAFDKAAVSDAPITADIGISDVVEGIENLPQDIKTLQQVMGKRGKEFMNRIKAVKKRYPEIKIVGANPTVAQFQAATSDKMEIGLSLRLNGPAPAMRAMLSELGIENSQREIYFMHGEGKPNGVMFKFKVKPRFKSAASLHRALKQQGVSEFNIMVHDTGGGLFIEQYVYGNDAGVEKMIHTRELFADKSFTHNEDFPVNSEILGNDDVEKALDNYRENIVKYFGEKKGNEVYEKAHERRKAYRKTLRGRALQAAAEGTGHAVQQRENAEGFRPGDSQAVVNRESAKYQLLTPAEKEALEHVGYSEEDAKSPKERTNLLELNFFERFLQNTVDSLYALAKLEKGKVLKSLSGYKSFNMLSNFPAQFSSFLRYGPVIFKNNSMMVKPEEDGGLFTVQQRLGNTSESFFKRLTAKSAQEILDKDDALVAAGGESRFKEGVNLFGKHKRTGELLDDREMVRNLFSATEQDYRQNKELWDWAERRLRKLNKSVLDFAENANMINAERRKVFEREFYIPFFRITDEEMGEGDFESLFPKSPGPTHIGKLHRLEGSHKHMGDPFANLINTYSFVLHESMKNLARAKSLALAKDAGLISKTNKAGKDTVGVRSHGRETIYKVHDPYLYQSLVDVDMMSNDMMSKSKLANFVFRKPKLWLTKYVTYDPAFRIANFVRDTLHTAAMQKGFIPFVSSAKGFIHAMGNTDEFKEYVSTGGAFSGAYHERDIRAKTAEEVAKLKKHIANKQKGIWHPKRWLDYYRRLGEASENAARMGVYLIQQKQGASEFEAAYEAKDLLDFHRSGASGFLKFFVQTVPFLNARIQGMYKLGRTGVNSKTRKNFYLVATMMTAASLAYALCIGDDDRYKELTDGDRLMYWHFFDVPGLGHVKIPRPFELGSFFGSIPESILDYIRGIRGGEETLKYISHIFRDMLRLDQPQITKVIYQQVANKNFFTGAPIVPPALEGAAPEAQVKAKTSKAAREIGKWMNALGYEGKMSSPLRIDHLFQDLFSYGAYFTQYMSDILLEHILDYPEDPAERTGEGIDRLIFGYGRFIKGKDEVPKYTKSQEKFYEMLLEANEAADTYRVYKRMRDRKKARKYKRENRQLIRASKQLSKYQRRASKLNQRIDIILASRARYTPEEKREMIDEILKRKHELYRKAVKRGERYLSDDKGASK